MREIVNTRQAAAWNGSEGRHWALHQDRYDAVNSGFNQPLFTAAAIREHERVLDVGCGNGQVTRLAARRAVHGFALGIDLSEPILDCARAAARREGVENAEFVHGDAQVHPFPGKSFDVAVSRFGVMFFGDPVTAFANIRRCLRENGRLAFVCLRGFADGELAAVLAAAAGQAGAVPGSPSGLELAGAFSLADPERTRRLLETAGFEQVCVSAVDATQVWGRDAADAVEFLRGWGPVRHLLEQSAPPQRARLLEALRAELARNEKSGEVRLNGAAWLVTAARGPS